MRTPWAGRARYRVLAAGWLALAASAAPTLADPPGRSVEELLILARGVSPDLAAARLEADAMAARASAAGALDDPTVRLETQDIDRRRGGILPSRAGALFYRIEQDFPLWGKRDLRRQIGVADAASAQARARMAGAELASRIKIAFAQHYQAHESLRINAVIGGLLRDMEAAARVRAEQSLGSQPEILQAEAERSELAMQRSDLQRDSALARARLNALLDRPVDAALAPPAGPRRLTAFPPLPALVDRMEAANPELAAERAVRAGAAGERKMADKAWYPDVTLGASVVDRSGTVTGYETMIGVRIPLQWGVKEAAQREAGARYNAADARIRAVSARARGELAAAWEGLQAAIRTERIISHDLLPQADAAWRSILAGYQSGRGEFAMLLQAQRRLQQARLDLLRSQVEQQVMAAEIEKLLGDEP